MADGVDIDLYADDIEHDFKQVKGIFRINMADISINSDFRFIYAISITHLLKTKRIPRYSKIKSKNESF